MLKARFEFLAKAPVWLDPDPFGALLSSKIQFGAKYIWGIGDVL